MTHYVDHSRNINDTNQLHDYFKNFTEVKDVLHKGEKVKITIIRPNIFRKFCNQLRYLIGLQEAVKVIIADQRHKILLPPGDRTKNLWEKVQRYKTSTTPLPNYTDRLPNCLRRIFGQQRHAELVITSEKPQLPEKHAVKAESRPPPKKELEPDLREIKDIETVLEEAKQQYEALSKERFFWASKSELPSYHYFTQDKIEKLTPTKESSEEDKQKILSESLRNRLQRTCRIDEAFSTIYKPLSKALAYMTLFYKEKYNIDIFLATSETNNITSLIEHAEQNNLNSFGAIIYWNKEEGHTSPLLFKREDNSKQWQAVFMDSVGESPARYEETNRTAWLKDALQTNNIPLFINCQLRQADTLSCHTDSLIVLRNALLDIQQKGELNFNDTLEEQLPHQWDYISQRESATKSPEMTITRDLFSKQPEKRSSPKKKEQFDQTHKKKLTIEETFSQKALSFTGTRESERNLYLLYKGAQILCTIGKNPTKYTRDTLNERCLGFQINEDGVFHSPNWAPLDNLF